MAACARAAQAPRMATVSPVSSASSLSSTSTAECRDCGATTALPSTDAAQLLHALRVFVAEHDACSHHVVVTVHHADGHSHGLVVPRPRDEIDPA